MSEALPYRISLAMIVRDEARCITRCLDSVRDVVDEMVVLDTGSIDDTVALAEAAGATVHHFTWVDDFSAARNAAITHCTGDWILVLDADEWLESGTEQLASLRASAPTFAGLVEIVNRTGDDVVSISPQFRVLPAGTRFAGRIHEQPQVGDEARGLAVRIGHDGYQAEHREKKVGRNQQLLELALVEDPENPYLWYQLAREHGSTGAHAAASLGSERALQLLGPATAQSPAWRHQLVNQYVASLVAVGRTQDALDFAFSELENWQHSADFHYLLGHALREHVRAHPELGDEVLPLVEETWQTCLNLGDSRLVGSVVGRGSFLAAQDLVTLYEGLGREEDADRLRPLARRQA